MNIEFKPYNMPVNPHVEALFQREQVGAVDIWETAFSTLGYGEIDRQRLENCFNDEATMPFELTKIIAAAALSEGSLDVRNQSFDAVQKGISDAFDTVILTASSIAAQYIMRKGEKIQPIMAQQEVASALGFKWDFIEKFDLPSALEGIAQIKNSFEDRSLARLHHAINALRDEKKEFTKKNIAEEIGVSSTAVTSMFQNLDRYDRIRIRAGEMAKDQTWRDKLKLTSEELHKLGL